MVSKELKLKKIMFYENQIIIKKRKQNIIIPLECVDKILYAKFSLKNYLTLGFGDWRTTGVIYIYLNENIANKKLYCFFLKYKSLNKMPEKIYQKIKFYIPGEPW